MSNGYASLSNWTFHTWLGVVYSVLLVVLIAVPLLRKRWGGLDSIISRSRQWAGSLLSDDFKKVLMTVLTVFAAAVYIYCLTCTDRGTSPGAHKNIFHVVTRLSIRVFPFFVIGCFLAGVLEKYFRAGRIPFPKSMVGNGVFASLIPMCSCAVVPLAQGMLHLHRVRVRAVITFLMVAPVLNPMVIPLSWGILGLEYLVLRIVAAFALGIITGIVVEKWVGIPEREGGPAFTCAGCSRSSSFKPGHSGSALMLGWDHLVNLAYYIFIGVAIGAMFSVYLPPGLVGKYLSNGSVGLLLSVLIGIPIFICAGEETIILAPLMDMGLPMGHAIAFTISGNAICVTSVAMLLPVFGKKTTAIMVGALFVGSLVFGALINALPFFYG
ncbi:MAG: permease, partial [bacterium]